MSGRSAAEKNVTSALKGLEIIIHRENEFWCLISMMAMEMELVAINSYLMRL
jgi:hypothetical protein